MRVCQLTHRDDRTDHIKTFERKWKSIVTRDEIKNTGRTPPSVNDMLVLCQKGKLFALPRRCMWQCGTQCVMKRSLLYRLFLAACLWQCVSCVDLKRDSKLSHDQQASFKYCLRTFCIESAVDLFKVRLWFIILIRVYDPSLLFGSGVNSLLCPKSRG